MFLGQRVSKIDRTFYTKTYSLIENESDLRYALVFGKFEVVKYLVEKGIDASDGGCLKIAAEKGYFKIIEFLVSKFTYTIKHKNKALSLAVKHGHTDVRDFLTKNIFNTSNGNQKIL